MTLFLSAASHIDLFQRALDKFHDGNAEWLTIDYLQADTAGHVRFSPRNTLEDLAQNYWLITGISIELTQSVRCGVSRLQVKGIRLFMRSLENSLG